MIPLDLYIGTLHAINKTTPKFFKNNNNKNNNTVTYPSLCFRKRGFTQSILFSTIYMQRPILLNFKEHPPTSIHGDFVDNDQKNCEHHIKWNHHYPR